MLSRIGVGGGAASSTEVQGEEGNEDLDFGAVQRGDPEMEQKLNRLIRACIEYEGLFVSLWMFILYKSIVEFRCQCH